MVKLNRKIEYALMALKIMAAKYPGQLTSVKEICASTQTPFDATSRVMQQMAQKQILKSEHGVHGGYFIQRDLSRVTFLDILEAVSGPVEVVRCLGEELDCEFAHACNLTSPLKVFNEKLSQFYKTLPVSELLQLKDFHREIKDRASV